MSVLSSTSNAFGNAVSNGNGIDENLKLQILAEEEAAMNQFKVGCCTCLFDNMSYLIV